METITFSDIFEYAAPKNGTWCVACFYQAMASDLHGDTMNCVLFSNYHMQWRVMACWPRCSLHPALKCMGQWSGAFLR